MMARSIGHMKKSPTIASALTHARISGDSAPAMICFLADLAAPRPRQLLLLLHEAVERADAVGEDAIDDRRVEAADVRARALDGEEVLHVPEEEDRLAVV